MYYIVYETINKINGKVYVGKHKTENIEKDTYIGSGNLIKRAVKKYGAENFERAVLFCAFTEEAAYEVEALIVNEEFVRRVDTYNLCTGGVGSYTMSQEFKDGVAKRMTGAGNPNFGKPMSESTKAKLRKTMEGRTLTDEHKAKISDGVKGENHPNFGKHHSEELKQKIRESNIGVPRSAETRKRISEGHKGLIQSQETKDKRAAYHIGTKRSDEARAKMREAKKGKTKTCPHCLKEGSPSSITRYHFNNCKSLNNLSEALNCLEL